MKPHIPAGYESCPRCGGMLPVLMTRFHICKGSDLTLRPANVSLERWSQLVPGASYVSSTGVEAQPEKPAEAPAKTERQPPGLSSRIIGVVLVFLLGIVVGNLLSPTVNTDDELMEE